jgi:quercetin dioxygenase-like cupin family protein
MKFIVSGILEGRSCIVRELDCTPSGDGMSMHVLHDLVLDSMSPRPPGHGDFLDIPVSPGAMKWMRVAFAPNQFWDKHHTDTIDCHTIVAGSIDLILDDGPHHLEPGDSAIVNGVDHAWQAGPVGCATSIILFGTPKPAD